MKKSMCCAVLLYCNLLFSVNYVFAQEKVLSAELLYNRGIDFYKKLAYNKAVESFMGAFNSENNKLEQWTNYNLGNSAFEQGQKLKQDNPGQARAVYQQALQFFHRAIELDPKDMSAKYNYE